MASKLTLLLQVVAGLSWTTLPAIGVFDTVPAEVGDVLSACSGDIISIKCGHTNTGGGVTRWIFSPPVNCSEIIEHSRSNDRQCGSSPFRFQDITQLAANVVLYSTAVATANTTMTGTTVQCLDSAGISPETVGTVIMCIFDHPTDIIVSNTENGVIIRWTFEFISHIPCNGSASFKVVISKSDGDNSTVNKTTADTRVEFNNLIAGQEYSAVVTTVLSSCSTDSEMTNFTFMASDPQSGSGKGSTLSTGEIIAIVIVITICLAIIFLILSVVLIFKRKKSKVRDDKSSGTTPICDESETCRKDSLIKENKGHEAFGMKNNGHHDEAEVKKDYPKGISDEPFIQRANEKELDPARIGGSTRETSVNQEIKTEPSHRDGSTRETSRNMEGKKEAASRVRSTTRETSVDKGGKTEPAGRGRSTTMDQSVNKKKNESHPRSGSTSRDPSINKEKKTGPGSNDGSTTAQSFNKEKRPEHFPIGKSIETAQPEKTDPPPGVSGRAWEHNSSVVDPPTKMQASQDPLNLSKHHNQSRGRRGSTSKDNDPEALSNEPGGHRPPGSSLHSSTSKPKVAASQSRSIEAIKQYSYSGHTPGSATVPKVAASNQYPYKRHTPGSTTVPKDPKAPSLNESRGHHPPGSSLHSSTSKPKGESVPPIPPKDHHNTGSRGNSGPTSEFELNKVTESTFSNISPVIGSSAPRHQTNGSGFASDTVTSSAGCVQKIASRFEGGSVTCTAPQENYDQNTGSLDKRGPTPEFSTPVDPSPPLHSTLNTPNMSAANTEIRAGDDLN